MIDCLQKAKDFVENDVIPAEPIYEEQLNKLNRWNGVPSILDTLKKKAKALGLWNLFLTGWLGLNRGPRTAMPDGRPASDQMNTDPSRLV